jgi:hypothetical protein
MNDELHVEDEDDGIMVLAIGPEDLASMVLARITSDAFGQLVDATRKARTVSLGIRRASLLGITEHIQPIVNKESLDRYIVELYNLQVKFLSTVLAKSERSEDEEAELRMVEDQAINDIRAERDKFIAETGMTR